MRTRWLAIALLLGAWTATAPVNAQDTEQPTEKAADEKAASVADKAAERKAQVDASVQRASEWLWSQQSTDGYWEYGPSEDKWLGMTALAALTLYEAGARPDDLRFQASLKYVRENAFNCKDTYSVSMALILLSQVGLHSDRGLIRSLAAKLVAGQTTCGGWDGAVPRLTVEQERQPELRKPPSNNMGNIAITQIAVLALWKAQAFGANLENSLSKVRQKLAWGQTETGGWTWWGLPDWGDNAGSTLAALYMWILSSSSEIIDARYDDKTELPPKPAKPQPPSKLLKLRKDLERDPKVTQDEIEKKIRAEDVDNPVDIYDALQAGAIKAKLAHNAWQQSGGTHGGHEFPSPRPKGSGGGGGGGTKWMFPPGDEPKQLYYVYPITLPPTMYPGKSGPLAEDPVMKKALARIAGFAKGIGNWLPYDMWCFQRVAVLMDIRKFGDVDFLEAGEKGLLSRQQEDGSWTFPGLTPEMKMQQEYNNGPETCYAILFLVGANLGGSATRMVSPDPEHPFTIKEQEHIKYEHFADAVKAASDKAIIVVRGDGPFGMSGVVIDKEIEIHAANGYEPVFAYERAKDKLGLDIDLATHPEHARMIYIKNKVTFEGIKFQMDPPNVVKGDWAVLHVESPRLRLLNCTFSEVQKRDTKAIIVAGDSRVLARNVFFSGFNPTVRVEASKRSDFFSIDNVLYGPEIFEVNGASGTFNLFLVESTVNAVTLMDAGAMKGSIVVQAEHNAIKTEKLISDLGKGERSWDGVKNLYDSRTWIAKGPPETADIEDLSGWKKYWETEEKISTVAAPPFRVLRNSVGPFRHNASPQDWAMDDEKLISTMFVSAGDQVGANVYQTGSGAGYERFRDTNEYLDWFKGVKPPSQRGESAETAEAK